MASIKKKSSGGGGANWMDTYGDMVTLLLCFFVLLYSISTVDQTKWMLVVQSFNKDALADVADEARGPMGEKTGELGEDMPAPDDNNEVDEALNELYDFLVAFQQEQSQGGEGEQSVMSISKGDGYVFISFEDAVFFDGNSYALRPDGRAVLDGIIPALAKAGPAIDELKVLGHTAQARSNEPNRVTEDRFLASNRATAVLVYLQQHISSNVLHPGRLLAEGCGQWRNVAPNDMEANRVKNRRVELVISGKNLDNALSDDYRQYYTMSDSNTGNTTEFSAEGNAVVSYSTNGN